MIPAEGKGGGRVAHGMIDLAQFAESASGESWIQIMKTGNWQHPKLKEVAITNKDLAQFKDNFDKRVRGVDLAVDVSHNPDAGATGWFKELKVDGDKLMAKVDWTEEGAQLVKSGKYRYFSPEFMFQWTDPATKQTHNNVMLGGALTNRPFLKDMEPIAFSESGMGTVWMSDDESMANPQHYASSVKHDDGTHYDPDGDGDDDSTTDPRANPDWMSDVKMGATAWPEHTAQQAELAKAGVNKADADKKFAAFQKVHPMPGHKSVQMSEPVVTNSHKTPPKGKPQNRDLYADPDNYKYPIDAKHVHAAVSYYNQGGMQSKGGYSDGQWSSVGSRIAKAAGDGYSLKGGKIETPSTHEMSEAVYDPEANPDDGISTPHKTDDTNAGKFTDGGGKMPGENVVTMAEFQAAQAKIQLLETENRQVKMTEKVRSWMFDESTKTGKIAPAQHDKTVEMLMGMSEEQVAAFSEFMAQAPAAISFGEHGTSADVTARMKETGGDKSDQVVKLAEKKMRDDHMEWKEAFIEASDELGVK